MALDITQIMPLTNGAILIFQEALFRIEILVGGLTGLYLINLVVQTFAARKNYQILKKLNTNLENLNTMLSGMKIIRKGK